MGLLSGLAKIAAPVVGNMLLPGVGGMLGGALAGAIGGDSKQSGTATTTNQQTLDPRAQAMLWGSDGKSGLLSQYKGMLGTPQSQGMQDFGKANNNYLSQYAGQNLSGMTDAAGKLMQGNGAALASLPSYAVGNMVQAPSQNNIDLSGAYKNMVYGDPASNPYLTGAIQKGIDQSSNAFNMMQDSATRNLTHNILPSIGSSAVLAGQYGGSRQGVAEGNAIGDFARAQQQQIGQFGQNNTDAAVAAQAGAFDNGQNRALSAMQGLGAQQYGVAGQNAATKNAAEFMNVGNQFDASKLNAGITNAVNAGNMGTLAAGAGLLGGLNGQAAGAATNDQNYGLNRATQVNGLLAPYLGMGQTGTTSQPLYQNQTGNMLGGAMLGGALLGGNKGGNSGGLLGGLLGGGSNAGGIGDLFGSSFGGGFF